MKRKTLVFIIAAVSALAAVPAVSLAGQARAHSNTLTFTDPAGDSGTGPDITGVTVSNDDSGTITFSVSVENRSQLGPNDGMLFVLDTDQNLTDGMHGFDYAIAVTPGGSVLAQLSSGHPQIASAPSFSGSYSGGVTTINVNRSDLGGTSLLRFAIVTSGDGFDTGGDAAPDSGIASYPVLVGGAPAAGATPTTASPSAPAPPAATTPSAPLTPAARVTLSASPLVLTKARSGQVFLASMLVRRVDTGELVDGDVSCSARVAGKPLRAVHVPVHVHFLASCAWRIPAGSRGKTLAGTITVEYQGVTVSRAFTIKVQ